MFDGSLQSAAGWNLWDELRCGLYLGDDGFGAFLQTLVGKREEEDAYPKGHRRPWRPTLQQFTAMFAEVTGIRLDLRVRANIELRKAFAYAARQRCGAPVGEIAAILGVSESAASKLIAAGRNQRCPQGAAVSSAVEAALQRVAANNRGKFRT